MSSDPSSILQAAANVKQGLVQWTIDRFNMKVAKQNARAALADGAAAASTIRDRARAAMGEQIAEQGGSGFQIGTGSNFDALHQSAVNRELDILNIRRQAQTRSNALTVEAGLDKVAGANALQAGLNGAASALQKGFDDRDFEQQQYANWGSSSPSGGSDAGYDMMWGG